MTEKAKQVRNYLRQIKQISISIRQKKVELAEIRETAQSISSADTSTEKVSASRKSTDAIFVHSIMRMEVLEKKIKDEIANLSEKKHEMVSRILCLENEVYSHILIMHYVQMRDFYDIAAETGYTYHYVINLHQKALTAFGEVFMNTEKAVS